MRVVVAVAAVLASAIAQERPKIADVAGLRDLDARAAFALGVHAPGLEIAALRQSLRTVMTPAGFAEVDEWLKWRNPRHDVSLADPDDWAKMGLDPARDFAGTIGEPGGFLGLPRELVAVVPVSDTVRFETFLADQVDAEGLGVNAIRRGSEPTTAALADSIWSFFGDRALILGRGGLPPEELRERMKVRVAAFGAGEGIGTREVYRHLRNALVEVPILGCYLRSSHWRYLPYPPPPVDPESDDDPDNQPLPSIAPDSESWEGALAFAHRAVTAAVQPPKAVRERIALSDGPDPVEWLRRLPSPDFELVVRARDPLAVAEGLGFERGEFGIPGEFARLLDELGAFGSLSVALWRTDGSPRPRLQIMMEMTQASAAVAVRDGLIESVRQLSVRDESLVLADGRDLDVRVFATPLGDIAIAVVESRVHIGDYDDDFKRGVFGEPQRNVEALGDRLVWLRARLAPWLDLAQLPIEPDKATGSARLSLRIDGEILLANIELADAHEKMSWPALIAAALTLVD
ncbi:MAG: hypothetical protein AB7I19_20420 [Planctomycetota bacterium]